MDLLALALVLAAAVTHAVWNRALHDTSDRTATLAVAELAGGIILLPASLSEPPLRVLPLVGLSTLAEVAYALCLSAAYQRGALSLTYPVGRGTAPLLVTLGGWLALAEPPTLATVAGAGRARGGAGPGRDRDPAPRAESRDRLRTAGRRQHRRLLPH